MKFFGAHLGGNCDQKQDGKDAGADKVAEIQRHRNGIAARLAKRGRQDFDDPENQCDFRHLAESGLWIWVHGGHRRKAIGCSWAHGWAVVCLCNLFKKLRLQPDVVSKTSEVLVDVRTHVESEQTRAVNLLDALGSPEAELEDAAAFFRKLGDPLRHFGESDGAGGFHGACFGLFAIRARIKSVAAVTTAPPFGSADKS